MKFATLTLCLLLISSQALADGGSPRAENKFGLAVGANDPAPGLYGFNIFYNFTDWAQLQLGAGFATDGVSDSVAKDLSTSMVSAVFYLITLGLIDWDDIYDYVRAAMRR